MYKVSVTGHFDAAHQLPGVEICERLHGHTWRVKVDITGSNLNDQKMLVDFRDIKQSWKRFDHQFLNDFFEMPTAECIAEETYRYLKAILPLDYKIKVKVWESPDCGVEYHE